MPEQLFKNLLNSESKKFGLFGSIEEISASIREMLEADHRELSDSNKSPKRRRKEDAQG